MGRSYRGLLLTVCLPDKVFAAIGHSLHRTYSADQIAALSKLSSSTVDELVRFGLLDPRGGLFGFCDLSDGANEQVSAEPWRLAPIEPPPLFAQFVRIEIAKRLKSSRHL
jgi:hypothetical protein